MRHLLIPLIGICTVVATSSNAFAQKAWHGTGDGGDGSWVAGSFSPLGLPGTTGDLFIFKNATYHQTQSDISMGVNHTMRNVSVGRGKIVNLTLESGASLTVNGFTSGAADQAGYTQSGTGATNVTITAASGAGVLKATQFVVGLDSSAAGAAVTGHRMTMTGEHLKVEVAHPSTATIVGRFNSGSILSVLDKAKVTLTSAAIGQSTNSNTLEVIGAGSSLTLSGRNVAGSDALMIGSVSPTASQNANNRVFVEGGSISITGTNNNFATQIGAALAQGGNHLEIGAQGTFTTVGDILINGHNASVVDRGANYLVVRDQGKLVVNGTARRKLTSAGHLDLEDGGTIEGNLDITMQNGSRFSAAGSGLNESVTTLMQSGSTLLVGTLGTEGETLTLSGDLTMASDSILRLDLFSATDYDTIHLNSDALLTLTGNVILELDLASEYTPVAGTSYTLFTGETLGIDGNFSLGSFDPTVWDVRFFNQEGGWRVVAIPEPSSVLLVLGAGALILTRIRRKVIAA